MSCSSYCRFKFVKLSAAIAFLLTSNLYAATIGSTHVKSTQYQPLAATIEVSDIDPDNFSVTLANQQIYQQMGLTSSPTMSVNFVKTSASSGKVIINTSSALTDPFADVVLTINDAGAQIVVPKTLLLPSGGATQPKSMSNQSNSQTTGNTKQPDLPVVNQTSDRALGQPILGKPLPINSSLPPPLNASASSVTPEADANTAQTTQTENNTSNTFAGSHHIQPLNINITRTYRSHQAGANLAQNTEILAQQDLSQNTTVESDPTSQEPTVEAVQKNEVAAKVTDNTIADTAQKSATNAKAEVQTTPTPDIALGKQTYTVQQNDNLWTIANQIAHENNLSVQTVMQQIKAYNQDAFINGDDSLLKTNAKLKLPDYKVIPSKLGIKAAIAARNAQQNKNSKSTSSSDTQKMQAKAKSTTNRNTPSSASATNKTITQALPRPHVTLVTPSSSGSSTGSQTSQSSTGTGINAELLAELKSSRQTAASKVQRVKSLSKQLADSTNRMQLQNQRLADLEQRLKDLRNK
ncbi:type IV pilus assembly protein FimV [Psychrobacter sp. I-STPA10]|uniref:type IV pilus assembly protein FimV n=1 Tax=Psychrobacter sp. I-STPA10 TaxID=2585769 RepID=UPI001E60435C|nr:LysM peptidoglycan-binding domain-containing protein [Psychrobacter sp. I-STPA10]